MDIPSNVTERLATKYDQWQSPTSLLAENAESVVVDGSNGE